MPLVTGVKSSIYTLPSCSPRACCSPPSAGSPGAGCSSSPAGSLGACCSPPSGGSPGARCSPPPPFPSSGF